ncbi:hypothetical protein DY000_02031651 [Brassica cretica]|uniref:Uncharacterized protein n=1 Tax=Brassica cretica TaxID=69181 RepID=A0ABQ7DF90_BRACR|nr:hypothetical protein DY000_02031651 [Brassica cretica]
MSRIPGPGSRSRVSGYPPYMEVKSNGSTKKQAPTTLLPLFPATNPDIPLKEIKAFYPLQTPGETQDPCLSKSPRLHPSTSYQTFCSPWFLLVPGPILRSDPRSLRICRFRVPTQSQCLQLLTPVGSGSSLHNKSEQPSDTMGAAITKQALDDIHTSRLTTPPHMGKMQGSQAGHNIFRLGLQLGRILKTGGNPSSSRIQDNTDSWVDRTPFSTHQIPLELFRERIPAKRREHCFSTSCKGAEEKCELYTRTCWPSDSWVQLEQRRVKEAGEHTFQLLFTSGFRVPATIHLWVPGSSFQVPDPRSRIPGPGSRSRVSGYPPYMDVKSNGSTKKQAPTTLLPLFPATNPDIHLKEIKAFYPLQTPGETQDPCLSKSPRLHPSTSCKKRKRTQEYASQQGSRSKARTFLNFYERDN